MTLHLSGILLIACLASCHLSPIQEKVYYSFPNHLNQECENTKNETLKRLVNDCRLIENLFQLDSGSVNIICKRDKASPQLADSLILKLSKCINDTTAFTFYCSNLINYKIYKGELAILCIYRIEPFPYEGAMRHQWCIGGPFNFDVRLPKYMFSDITLNSLSEMKTNYLHYFNGDARRDWQYFLSSPELWDDE